MTTLPDEILQDFGDSGSHAGGEGHDDDLYGFSNDDHANGDMIMDEYKDDDDDEADADNVMQGMDAGTTSDLEDEKARIEKLKLGGVRDVRSVASLMKT